MKGLSSVREQGKGLAWALGAFLDQRLAYARGAVPRTLPLLYVEVTSACNLRCVMCGYPTHYPGRGASLSTEELRTILGDSRELGTKVVSLGGGEPFLREDLLDLISHAEGLGLSVHVNTNGTLLDEAVVDRLAGRERLTLVVSLDHPEPERNDRIRGEGAFDGCERAIRLLRGRAPKVNVGINAVIGRHNLGHLQRMVDLAARWGVDGVKFLPLHDNLAHRWRGEPLPDSMLANLEEVERLSEEACGAARRARALGMTTSSEAFLRRMPRLRVGPVGVPCYAGYLYGNIDPYGRLFPCYDKMDPPLDVRSLGLAAAWRSEAMQKMRERVRACTNRCWNSGNAEPSLRMSLRAVASAPSQLLADLGFYVH